MFTARSQGAAVLEADFEHFLPTVAKCYHLSAHRIGNNRITVCKFKIFLGGAREGADVRAQPRTQKYRIRNFIELCMTEEVDHIYLRINAANLGRRYNFS